MTAGKGLYTVWLSFHLVPDDDGSRRQNLVPASSGEGWGGVGGGLLNWCLFVDCGWREECSHVYPGGH